MIQLTDAHAHIKNEKQAMERITLGIPTMACAGTPGEMQELEKFGRLQGAEKILIPACRPSSMVSVTNGNRKRCFP